MRDHILLGSKRLLNISDVDFDVLKAAWRQYSCNMTTLVPHTSGAIQEALHYLKFEPIPRSPYFPELASCDFYFFYLYTSDDEVKAVVKSWIREKSEFFTDGMKKLVTR